MDIFRKKPDIFGKFEKLIIVSNRLPFSVKSDLSLSKSPGGLVSGIETFLKKSGIENYVWIGWPGANLNKKKF